MAKHGPNTGTQRGARPVGEDNTKSRKKLLWLLLPLLLLILLAIYLLSQRGNDTPPQAASAPSTALNTSAPTSTVPSSAPTSAAASSATTNPTSTPGAAVPTSTPGAAVPTTPPVAPAAPAQPGAGSGTLTANGAPLLPLSGSAPGGTLAPLVGQSATATGVTVQAVVPNQGFWVGTSATDRVWVELPGSGQPPYPVMVGDRVCFTGPISPNPVNYPPLVGVTSPPDIAQLNTQAAHIDVDGKTVTINPPA